MKKKKELSFYEVYRSLCFLVILIGLCLNFVSFAKIYQNKRTYTEEVTATITSTADMDVYKTDTEISYLPTYEVKYHGKILKFKKSEYQKNIPRIGDQETFKIDPKHPEDYDKGHIEWGNNVIGILLVIASINALLIGRKYRRDLVL